MLGGEAGQPASSACCLLGEFTEPSVSFYVLCVSGSSAEGFVPSQMPLLYHASSCWWLLAAQNGL